VLVIYTAAFSGRPGGAMMSHLGFLIENLMIANLQRVDHETVFLNSGPLFHIGNWMTTMATMLFAGTNVFERRFDPEEFCAVVEREGVTSAYVVGPMQDRIVEANADGRWNLKSLRSGPGSDAWNAMVTVRETPWTAQPGGFGQTEVNGLCTWRSIGGVGEGSHGRPFPFVQLAILDEDGRELPPGSVGEIGVRGPTVLVGYHDRAEENARRRRGSWHHTHDLGRREADGSLTFVGPKTTMIKSGVENIYPAEVEAAIRRHPAVADVCVIGVPDPQWDQSVKAVVVLREGASATEDEIIAHTRSLIASYKKPRAVVFVASLPRDASGFAVDRAAVDQAHGGAGYPGTSRLRG
jgi:long-chain acyl-CoA synthetase